MAQPINPALTTQATIYQILLRGGLLTGAKAVAWADDWLMRLDTLPDELINISLSGGNSNEIFTALNRLALPTLSEQAFRQICAYLLEKLENDGSMLSVVNSLFWRIYYDDAYGDRPLEFIPNIDLYWFAEEASLIADGSIDMTLDDLRQQVTEFLASYAIKA